MEHEHYLGDGLYASFDGLGVTLRTPRENGDHWVYLEDHVLAEFLLYVNTLTLHPRAGQ